MTINRPWLVALVLSAPAASQVLPYRALDSSLPLNVGTIDASGDFDGDGKRDLLGWSGILLGDGHANFTRVPGSPLAGSRMSTRVADLNGDGLLDVASILTNGQSRVDFNVGGLVFTQVTPAFPQVLNGAGLPLVISRLTPGDVDSDGDVDILAQTKGLGQYAYAEVPALLLNNGAATFIAASLTAFPAGNVASNQEELVDVDSDGDLDVLLAGVDAAATTLSLSVMTGNGSGSFAAAVPIMTSPVTVHFATGEFNGDGYMDLIANRGGLLNVEVFFGSAAGFTTTPVASQMPFWPGRLVTIDLDANGRDELLASGWPGTVGVFPVATSGAVGVATQSIYTGVVDYVSPHPDTVADYDQDGDRDLVLTILGQASLLMNDSAGSLVRPGGRLDGASFAEMPVGGDVDQDGDLDLVGWGPTAATASVVTAINDGDGFFPASPPAALPGLASPQGYMLTHAFDRDGDGDSDLYCARNNFYLSGIAVPDRVLDASGGAYTVAFTLTDNRPVTVIRDLDADGDGDRDIVLGRRSPTTTGGVTSAPTPMLLMINAGAGGFVSFPIGGDHKTYDLEIADFDGDGTEDVFQTNFVSTGWWAFDACVLYLRTSPGAFTAYPQAMTGIDSAAGDLNGDGLPDVVVDNQVWFNGGGGAFVAGPTLNPPIGSPPTLVDVDGDGDLDLVESPAAVRFNSGGAAFGPRVSEAPYIPVPLQSTSAPVPQSVVADLDRDGDPDIFGSDMRVHLNCSRQVAFGMRPRPGRPGSLQLFGNPGNVLWLFAAGATANLAYPPFGTVLIDPATAIIVHGGTFGTLASPTPGLASIQGTLPPNPALAGLTSYWQMVDVTASRLSNRLKTTVGGY
jgi:hypothetical protein